MDGIEQSADVHSVDDKVNVKVGDDVIDGEFLLKDVWCDGGVRDFGRKPELNPNDWACNRFNVGFASFDDTHGLAVDVIIVHDDRGGFIIPK